MKGVAERRWTPPRESLEAFMHAPIVLAAVDVLFAQGARAS